MQAMKIDESTFRPGPENDAIVTLYRRGDVYRVVTFGESGKTWNALTAAEVREVLDQEFFKTFDVATKELQI